MKRQVSIENKSHYDNFLETIEKLPLLELAGWDKTTLIQHNKGGFYIKQMHNFKNNKTDENSVFVLKMTIHTGEIGNRVHAKIFKLKSGKEKPERKNGIYNRKFYNKIIPTFNKKENGLFKQVAELKYNVSFHKFSEESEVGFLSLSLKEESKDMKDHKFFDLLVQSKIVLPFAIVVLLKLQEFKKK